MSPSQLSLFDPVPEPLAAGAGVISTAHHEAAHAIMGRLLGGFLHGVDIIDIPTRRAGCSRHSWLKGLPPEEYVLRQLLVMTAGLIGSEFFRHGPAELTPHQVAEAFRQDDSFVGEWIQTDKILDRFRFVADTPSRRELLYEYGSLSSTLLCPYWHVQLLLAERLLAVKKLTGNETVELIDGPLLGVSASAPLSNPPDRRQPYLEMLRRGKVPRGQPYKPAIPPGVRRSLRI